MAGPAVVFAFRRLLGARPVVPLPFLEIHREGLHPSALPDDCQAPAVRVGPLVDGAVPPQELIPEKLEDMLHGQDLGQPPDALIELRLALQEGLDQRLRFLLQG